MRIPGDKDRRIVGQLRRTQLVSTFGPGALVDLPDCSVVIADVSYWEFEDRVLHEERLERLLGVKYFRVPRASDDSDGKGVVKAFRFPEWHYCPNCHRLAPAKELEGRRQGFCGRCKENNRLVPSSFVLACENGHIDDFPYRWWVHRGSEKKCDGSVLEIEFDSTRGGLEGIGIRCKKCGARKSMAGVFDAGAFEAFHCRGRKPWLGHSHYDEGDCAAQVRVVQKSASNVYFPITERALSVPAFDLGPLTETAARNWGAASIAWPLFDDAKKLDYCERLLAQEGLSNRYAPAMLVDEFGKYASGFAAAREDLVRDEYAALTAPDQNGRDFKTVHVAPPDSLSCYIDDVVLVKRLREILALRGFRRLSPDAPEAADAAEEPQGGLHEKGLVPSTQEPSWLPAMELLGEGIFISFNAQAVNEWAARIGNRYVPMKKRLAESGVTCRDFSSKYVLLHTLSHLLIRQLASDCGYSSASIREKIYASGFDEKGDMAGILLYTSSPDSDGSLGGLVRQGKPEHLRLTFENMLNAASWCSSDPLCGQSMGQGFGGLNYAACHACALVPETSCVMHNSLLDRVSVVGEPGNPALGFFSSWFT